MALAEGIQMFHCIGIGLLFIGNILHIIGLATPSWTIVGSSTYSVGLWKTCLTTCFDLDTEQLTDVWRAAEAFAILGMIFGLASLAGAVVYLLSRLMKKDLMDRLQLVTLIVGIVALLFIIVSVSCYGGGVHKNFESPVTSIGYSLILSIIGGIIIMIGAVVFNCPCRTNTPVIS